MSQVACKICNHNSTLLFNTVILKKHSVNYYKCSDCGFIQTETPFWLSEAYNSAITSIDIGLTNRNEITKQIVKSLCYKLFKGEGKYVDYGGGYGMLVRMLRDAGLQFYRQDIYCDNLFAKHFDITDLVNEETNSMFSMLTAFEVFEHLENPIDEMKKMLEYSHSIFFSTLIVPPNIQSEKDWWYFTPETGQHIALYSIDSLKKIAEMFNLNFYTNGTNYHLFTKKKINSFWFSLLTNYTFSKIYNFLFYSKKTLLQSDFEFVKRFEK